MQKYKAIHDIKWEAHSIISILIFLYEQETECTDFHILKGVIENYFYKLDKAKK